MPSFILRHFVLLFLMAVGTAVAPAKTWAASPEVNLGYFNKLAMNGYDVMTYWQGGDPQKGDPEIMAQHNGATWVFQSEENRQAFLSDPAKYAPQYGGYCAYAVSRGYTASGDPGTWRIVDGKLYLVHNPGVETQWASDVHGNIARAEAHWPGVLGE